MIASPSQDIRAIGAGEKVVVPFERLNIDLRVDPGGIGRRLECLDIGSGRAHCGLGQEADSLIRVCCPRETAGRRGWAGRIRVIAMSAAAGSEQTASCHDGMADRDAGAIFPLRSSRVIRAIAAMRSLLAGL